MARIVLCICIALASSVVSAKNQPCPNPSSPFLQQCGTKLYYQGKVYRSVSIMFYQAFRYYLDLGWDGMPKGEGKAYARKTLAMLASRGFDFFRVMGPYYPVEFTEVFFDDDVERQAEKRARFLATLDEFLDDCERLGILVSFPISWNGENWADLGGHSLHKGITDQESPGWRKLEEFARVVITHCRMRRSIGFWEVPGNEYNLWADLRAHAPLAYAGVLRGITEGDALHPGPVYRGSDNHFTSAELVVFFHRLARLVKELDQNHLIWNGIAEPRPNAMKLFLAASSGEKLETGNDTLAEHEALVTLLNRDFDAVTTHYYLNEHIGMTRYKHVADKLGKPLFIGEAGPHFTDLGNGRYANADYADPKVLKNIRQKMDDMLRNDASLVLWWAVYDCAGEWDAFKVCYGKTDTALQLFEKANLLVKKK